MAKYIYLNADIRNKDWRKELFTKFTKEHKNKLSQQDFAKFNIMLEEQEQYSTMKVSELKKLAQTKGLTGYTKLNKAGLVNLLENN